MDCKPSSGKKEKWGNQVVCGFYKPEQMFQEKQLSTAQDGTPATESLRG